MGSDNAVANALQSLIPIQLYATLSSKGAGAGGGPFDTLQCMGAVERMVKNNVVP